MALRFRCEHCGKRLQVEQEPGTQVMCPYCKSTVAVPADAQEHTAAAQQQAQGGAQAEDEELEEESTGDTVIAFLGTYLPSWGTSVMLHLALILVALMATWVSSKPPEEVEYQTETVRVEKKKLIRKMDKSAPKSRTTRRAQSKQVSSFVFKTSDQPIPDVAPNKLQPVEVIGVGGGGRNLGGLSGFGTGRGGGAGGQDFFGVGGVADKIVYVVDRSGSMTDSIMYVKYELRRSIRMLKPNQRFFVVFYSTGPAVGMPVGKLVPATEANKMMAYEFIDSIVPVGQTDPSDALVQAFKLQPDLIYLLTDGEFDRKIIDLIDKQNRSDKVTVHTFCFIYTSGEAVLQEIAQRNDGEYKYIGEGDLQNLGR